MRWPISDVRLDVFVFLVGELARLAEHAVVDADLADVVQQAGEVDRVERLGVAAEFLGQSAPSQSANTAESVGCRTKRTRVTTIPSV